MTFHESLSKSTTEWQISVQRKGHKNITYSKHYWGFRSMVLNSLLRFLHMIHYVGLSPPLHTPYISPIIIQEELLKLPLSVKFFLFSIEQVRNKIFQDILNWISWENGIEIFASLVIWYENCGRSFQSFEK